MLYSQKENLAIVVIYRQPDDKTHGNVSSSPQFSEIMNKISIVISQINSPTPDIIIGGDFNLPHINWLDNSFDNKCKKDEKIMFEKLFEFCNMFQLDQYVNKSTHKDGNILDLVFTNNDNLIHNLDIIPTLLSVSHHSIIQCSTLYGTPFSEENVKGPKLSRYDKLNFFSDKTDWAAIEKDFDLISWSEELSEKSVDDMLNHFYDTC